MNTDYLTVFPNPSFSRVTEDTGTAVCTTSIGDMVQCFAYGFESYSGSTLALNTGCFPHEVAVLTGIAAARLMAWDVAGWECGPNF